MSDTTLIYLHIPKCGGTTLNRILQRNFNCRYFVNAYEIARSEAELRGWTVEERLQLDLLHGHLSYGWHELIPRKTMYFTIVRNPVARVVSHYNYVRFRSDHAHYLREAVEREKMTLADYVQSGVCDEVNNGQVRLLSGVEDIVQQPYGDSRVRYGTNDTALLEQALNNIDAHFAVVGLQEDFDATLLLLKSYLGIRKIRYEAQNIGNWHYTKVQPTTRDIAVIEGYNRLDIALYENASRRFKRQFANLFFPGARTKLFRFANGAYNRSRAARRTIQRLV